MQSAELAAGTVEYYESGRDGPTLVFLTGVLVGVTVWRHVLADLRADHRCIAIEMPLGAHRVPMSPGADLSSGGLAELVSSFLATLGLDDVTLIGCDWGGAQLVAAYGLDARVSRLVLLPQESFDNFPPGVPGRSLHRSSKVPGATWLALQSLRVRALRRGPVNFGPMTKRPVPADIMDAWLAPALASAEIRRDLLKYLRATNRGEYLEAARKLAAFDKPALVLWAPESRMMRPQNGRRLAGALPRARLVEVPDSYVLIPEDQPAVCAREIREFVATG
jgi:pimeloyl-ACP methyl ester carboxylesterase